MNRSTLLLLLLSPAAAAHAASVIPSKDPKTGWTIYRATAGETSVKVAPDAGCNVYSIKYRGRELLRQPDALEDLPGVGYGTPILYPTPNRVRNASFSFRGNDYRFKPNSGANFIHGLVHRARWRAREITASDTEARLSFDLPFASGNEHYAAFPLPHLLRLVVTVTDGAVRWTYTVDNTEGKKAIPFGFALHPWFLYQGTRKDTYLTVPATHWMEARKRLPTGKLVPLTGTPFDARKPISLAGFVVDDVYFGMRPEAPTVIDFRDEMLKLRLATSADFTHLVVYTPAEKPWFCVENQTCSTDAHNLHGRGLAKEAHLLVVEPNGTHTGFAEFRFDER